MELDHKLMLETLRVHSESEWAGGCSCGKTLLSNGFPDHVMEMYERALYRAPLRDDQEEAMRRNELVLRIELDGPTMDALHAYANISRENVIKSKPRRRS